MFGGAGAAARAAVKGLGLQGLDAGFGCGVGIGYGFGAGLMLKPSVAEQMMRTGKQLAGKQLEMSPGRIRQLQQHQQWRIHPVCAAEYLLICPVCKFKCYGLCKQP